MSEQPHTAERPEESPAYRPEPRLGSRPSNRLPIPGPSTHDPATER